MGIDLAINTASAYMFDVSRKTTVSNTSKNDAFRESLGKQIAHQPYHKMDQATFLAYQDNVMKNGGSKELSYIHGITKSYCTGKPGAITFEDAFPQYQVTTHIGNTDVSKANWQRNDFPFWNYFDKSASADCLNDWKPTGPNPSLSDANVQKRRIEYRQMIEESYKKRVNVIQVSEEGAI